MRPSITTPISTGKVCDYCKCGDCQSSFEEWKSLKWMGEPLECADGTHVCDICFCTEGCNKTGKKCENFPKCEHKPMLKDYSKFEKKEDNS